jgi:two-component system CheB/CheR fusion protein
MSDAQRKSMAAEYSGMPAVDENRFRNVLSVLRSFIRHTAESSTNVESYAAHLEARMDAYSRLTPWLGSDGAHGISLAFLVAESLHAFAAREQEHFALSGPDIRLFGKTAESLGLALNELALNALEHGALGNGGMIQVNWQADDCLRFIWQETGLSSAPSLARAGFGLKLLNSALPFDLGAKVHAATTGDALCWEIEIPAGAQWWREGVPSAQITA